MLGLLAWLYLQAQATLYVAEANVVWVRRLWPRSLAPPPHTEEDVRAYQLYAEAETRSDDQKVSVTFWFGSVVAPELEHPAVASAAATATAAAAPLKILRIHPPLDSGGLRRPVLLPRPAAGPTDH